MKHARTDAPQGVVARAEPVTPTDVDEFLAAPDAFLFTLDGVTARQPRRFLRCAKTAG